MRDQFQRTHDLDIYLKENRYEKPKELFKQLTSYIVAAGILKTGCKLCDVGCAAGEYLYYLNKLNPTVRLTGLDMLPQLLEKAKAHLPEATYICGSVLDDSLLPADGMDVCTMMGVHSIFDEFEGCFGNLLKWTRSGGRVYIAGCFNPYPIDVWVYYKHSNDSEEGKKEVGWNNFSEVSIARFLDTHEKVKSYNFHPFEMPFDLTPQPEDLLRTWTMQEPESGKRILCNGLSIIVNIKILEICLK